MKTGSVFSLAIVAALLALACNGQNEESVARRSADGTQEGSITLSRDGTSGAVSSSSQGSERAFASSSLVIGPGTTEGSFSAEGDTQQVSDTLSVDPEQEEVQPEENDAQEEEAVLIEEQTVPEEPEAKQPESVEQPQEAPEEKENLDEEEFVESSEEGDEKRKVKKDPYTIGGSGTRVFFSSSGSDTGDAEKVCLVGDDSEFQKYLDDGYEVTLVQATEQGHVKITTALELPSVSSKHSVTARYIPQEIKERCDVNYEDLGLEDRTDGEASLSSSGSSFHFSSSAGSGGSPTSSDIRKRVFGHLCNQPFFRNYAMLDECKDHEDIEDEDNYPWG